MITNLAEDGDVIEADTSRPEQKSDADKEEAVKLDTVLAVPVLIAR